MSKKHSYYNSDLLQLEVYQQLIQYWSIMFEGRKDVTILDNMNFNLSLFPEVISLKELVNIHRIEPGYMSPDGYTEMHLLIRELEYTRLTTNKNVDKEAIRRMVNEAGIGCGNGCTGVMNAIINSIMKLNNQSSDKKERNEIVLTLPNYTVYTAQMSNLAYTAQVRYAYTSRSSNFIPTFEDIAQVVSDKTAMIIITYPNNPAQSTYHSGNKHELEQIIKLCKQKGIFLIVDNIYQDLLYSEEPFTEIFDLTNSLDYIIKVYGSSKDTPFFSGFRTGYWFGDPRVIDIYKYYISSTENSLNTYSLTMFAYNLYFKLKKLTNSQLELDDMKYFSNGVFGWSQVVDEETLFHKIEASKIFEHYLARSKQAIDIQKNAIKQVRLFVEQSTIFADYVNEDIGNVFFIKVNESYFNKSDRELFDFLYDQAKCGVLPGSVFGIKKEVSGLWFRITLLHDQIANIIKGLKQIEKALIEHQIDGRENKRI